MFWRINAAPLIVILLFSLIACGGDETPTPQAPPEPTATTAALAAPTTAPAAVPTATPPPTPTEAPTPIGPVTLPLINPSTVNGLIKMAGSNTLYPVSAAVAQRMVRAGAQVDVRIEQTGTSAGFEQFCQAEGIDIVNASRPIRKKEIESCQAVGREPIEFQIGTEALVVSYNVANTFLDAGVTLEQLAHIFSKDATTWSDIDPSWPAEPIKRFATSQDGGRIASFIGMVMDPIYIKDQEADAGKGEEALRGAANLVYHEDETQIAIDVAKDINAIGMFGYTDYLAANDVVKLLRIDNTEPTVEQIHDYPLARPSFIYSDAKIMTVKPQVAAYINFYLGAVNREIIAVGLFPATEEALNGARYQWMLANEK